MKRLKNIKFRKEITLLALAAAVFLFGIILLWAASLRLPDLDTFEERIVRQSTKIYDRTGEVLLYDVHENVQRTIVAFDDISRNMKNATVAIEDAEFYEHPGVKISSTARAILQNIISADLFSGQGGSTITQQVVKNALLTTEKTPTRKIKEWILSIKLEQSVSKETILTHYLNEAPYGGNLYGVEEAAQSFFGKSAADLNLVESAYLAALPQAPTYYSPYGSHLEDLEKRKELVLEKMLENKFISEEEFEEASKEVVEFLPRSETGIRAPHFVIYVKEYLIEKYGERAIEEDGLRVITTLDAKFQGLAEEIVKRHALSNEKNFNAENAGLVGIDPRTGHVLVMVGSRDYFDEEIDGNFNVTLAHRQPGSSFKPFVYATAFKRGYTPKTVVFDLFTEFSTTCSPNREPLSSDSVCYHPTNYDSKFRGPMTLRDALAQSVNIPAVKVLYLAGLDESLKTARDMGITSLTNKDQYGLTLVLGGGEVSPLEMAGAYSVFANDGVRNPPVPIVRVEDKDGNVLESFEENSERALDADIARKISDILSDNVARTPAFGPESFLNFPGRDVAVKTGTTNDYRDAWIVGYTPSISVAAWAGNNDNSPMEKRVAGFIVAPMWNEFMQEALQTLPREQFRGPEEDAGEDLKPVLRGFWQGGTAYVVDKNTGKLATNNTPEELRETRVVRSVHSILHWVDKTNPRGLPPVDPSRDPQYTLWETPVRQWALMQGYTDEDEDIVPNLLDSIHTTANSPKITITGIATSPYKETDVLQFGVSSSGAYDLSSVEIYINNRFITKKSSSPFIFSIPLSEISRLENENDLRIIGRDEESNKGEKRVQFDVSL